MDWEDLKKQAYSVLEAKQLSEVYRTRLDFECNEIIKQGANNVWVEYYKNDDKWDTNPNGLVLPYLLDMTPIDPIIGEDKLMIYDKNGTEQNAIIIVLDDGSEVCVSENTLVGVGSEFVRAIDLYDAFNS